MSGSALFPLFTQGAFGSEFALFVQILIGMGFGFALERGGFARAENLVSIFYGRDFRVMRVMFTAIITALGGLVILAGAGAMDMGMLYINETFMWAQLVGGFLLGAGFVISGYCPGTSLVGLASGRIDALLVIAGVPIGSWIYAEAYPWVGSFANAASMGTASLPSTFGAPTFLVAAGVFVFAAMAFLMVGRIETWVRKKFMGTDEAAPGPAPIRLDPRRAAPHHILFVVGLVGVLALGGLYATRSQPSDWGRYIGPDEHAHEGQVLPSMTATQLARAMIDSEEEIAIVDIREGKTDKLIPGAMLMSASDLIEAARSHTLPHVDAYVLVCPDGKKVHELAPELAAHGLFVSVLEGGMKGWDAEILTAPKPPSGSVSKAQVKRYEQQASLHAYFTNSAAAAPKVKASPVMKVAPKKRKGGGCS